MSQEYYTYDTEPEAEPRSRRLIWIGAAVLAAILAACVCVVCLAATYLILSNTDATPTPTAPPPVSIDQVVNIQWQWVELVESDPASQPVVPDPDRYAVVFRPDGQLHVKADCNVANGAYRAEGNWLAVNMGPMTTAQCPPGSLSVQFVGLLANVDSFGLEGDQLVLGLRDAAGRMVFRYGGPAPDGPLAPTATPAPTGEAAPEPTATGAPAPEPTPTAEPGPEPTPTAGDLPQPVIVAPSEAKPREAVIFDGSQSQPGSSPITGYGWDFGDGGRAEGATVNHVYGQPGSYAVTLTVRDEAGLSNSATTQINIREAGAPAPGPTSEAEGELIGPTWQWTELNQDVPSLVPNPERYTLRFLGAGALEYVADCALGRATYAIQNDGLRIDLGATSPPECGPDSQANQYLELLNSVVTFELDGDRLNLYLEGGGGHMAFFPGAE
jgi:heat shock protein HslJ